MSKNLGKTTKKRKEPASLGTIDQYLGLTNKVIIDDKKNSKKEEIINVQPNVKKVKLTSNKNDAKLITKKLDHFGIKNKKCDNNSQASTNYAITTTKTRSNKTRIDNLSSIQENTCTLGTNFKNEVQRNNKISSYDYFNKLDKKLEIRNTILFEWILRIITQKVKHKYTDSAKVVQLLEVCVSQFFRSNPDSMWSTVYNPIFSHELIDNSNVEIIKYWIKQFFYQLKLRNLEESHSGSRSDYSDFSNSLTNTKIHVHIDPNLEKELSLKEQEIVKDMEFISLVLVGKEGIGRSTLVNAICNEMKLGIIEISNSDNRNGDYIKTKFSEATQSQNLYSKEKSCSNIKDNEDSDELARSSIPKHKINQNKKLILVKDFDVVLDSDRGFQQKIIEYIKNSKSPMILLCEDIPKQKLTADILEFEEKSLEDLSLLFYIIIQLEKLLQEYFKDIKTKLYAYISQSLTTTDDADEDSELNGLIEELKLRIKSYEDEVIGHKVDDVNLEENVLNDYDDVCEIVSYLNGNLHSIFSRFYHFKNLFFENNLNEIKKLLYAEKEILYKRVPGVCFYKADMDQLQIMNYSNRNKVKFKISVEDFAQSSNLSRALLLLNSLAESRINKSNEKDKLKVANTLNHHNEHDDYHPDNLEKSSIEDLETHCEILGKLQTFDVYETKIIKQNMSIKWDEQLDIDKAKKDYLAVLQEEPWTILNHNEREYEDTLKMIIYDKKYLKDKCKIQDDDQMFEIELPIYDRDKMMLYSTQLKQKAVQQIQDLIFYKKKNLADISEVLVLFGNELNKNYKPKAMKTRLRTRENSKASDHEKKELEAKQ